MTSRPAAASGQPAVAAYVRAPYGGCRLHALQLFGGPGGLVRGTVVYADEAVFDVFGLAAVLWSVRPRAAVRPRADQGSTRTLPTAPASTVCWARTH